ncbi:TerD family protein, partial [Streptomyces sp. NPDC002586]
MGISLAKGGNVSLSKEAPGLTAVEIGLGWDVRTTTGADYDLDASALLLNASGKVISDQHFVFYNNLRSPDGSVEHTGDNLTGEGEGDDEVIKVNLAVVPADVDDHTRATARCAELRARLTELDRREVGNVLG